MRPITNNISKPFLLLSMLLTMSIGAIAQNNYALELKNDKRVVNIDALNLPGNTIVLDLLKMLPELLERPQGASAFAFINYDVRVNDISTDESRDAILTQMRIEDVKQIEISQSTTSVYKNGGQGGVINIILKDTGEEGISGSAELDVMYETDVMLGGLINYKKNGWKILGMLKGEYYNPEESMTTKMKITDHGNTLVNSYDGNTFLSQIGRLTAEYTTTSDVFSLSAGYSYSNNHDTYESFTYNEQNDFEKMIRFHKFMTETKYKHIFNKRNDIGIEANYKNNLNRSSTGKEPFIDTQGHNTSAKLAYFHHILNKSGGKLLDLESTLSGSWLQTEGVESYKRERLIMPYVKAELYLKRWSFLTSLEYQNYDVLNYHPITQYLNYHLDGNISNITGMLVASWQFTDQHLIRFTTDRKLERQTDYSLTPVKVDEFDLSYITDWHHGNNDWLVNTGVCNVHASDIKDTHKEYKVYNLNGMVQFHRYAFTLTYTGNYYYRSNITGEDKNSQQYFNMSIMPAVTYQSGWNASILLTFNSKVKREEYTEKANLYTRFSVGKRWKRLSTQFYANLRLTNRNQVYGYLQDMTEISTNEIVRNYIGIGVKYRF